MKEYQKRVVDEAEDLVDNMVKLAKFEGTGEFSSLPDKDKGLLCDQLEVMATYHEILLRRVRRFLGHE